MSKVDITDNALTSKDGEILRLLNQIASDMVQCSDVDEMITAAVKEARRTENDVSESCLRLFAHSELQAL